MKVPTDEDHLREDPRKAGVLSLLRHNVLRKMKRSMVREGERGYGCRFVDTLKADGVKKSRVQHVTFPFAQVVAQNYHDQAA